MKTMFIRSRARLTECSRSKASTCPRISPGVRLRFTPSNAVRQNWQLTAQPTWEETHIVALDLAGVTSVSARLVAFGRRVFERAMAPDRFLFGSGSASAL